MGHLAAQFGDTRDALRRRKREPDGTGSTVRLAHRRHRDDPLHIVSHTNLQSAILTTSERCFMPPPDHGIGSGAAGRESTAFLSALRYRPTGARDEQRGILSRRRPASRHRRRGATLYASAAHRPLSRIRAPPPLQPCRMATILYLDDEPAIGLILEDTLERAGHVPIGAHTVPEALQALSKGGVDLIISDYRMPGRTGLEFLELPKQEGYDIPLFILTRFARIEHSVPAINP